MSVNHFAWIMSQLMGDKWLLAVLEKDGKTKEAGIQKQLAFKKTQK